MDKKWFSEFAFYSAFKELGPTPAQRPWEETRYLVYRSTLEIMCQTRQKWASFLRHQSLLEPEGTLQNQVESSERNRFDSSLAEITQVAGLC